MEQPILPLPTRYCPCPTDTAPAHLHRRGPLYCSDFFSNHAISLLKHLCSIFSFLHSFMLLREHIYHLSFHSPIQLFRKYELQKLVRTFPFLVCLFFSVYNPDCNKPRLFIRWWGDFVLRNAGSWHWITWCIWRSSYLFSWNRSVRYEPCLVNKKNSFQSTPHTSLRLFFFFPFFISFSLFFLLLLFFDLWLGPCL